jgi:cytosine/adenosine deaminase-related metal-dependent hydrolase
MRTLIQGGWVVGFDGTQHELLPDGVVVYENDRVVYVGHHFEGRIDRRVDATGKLVSPGLINCHFHSDSNAREVLLADPTKTDYYGSNWLAFGAFRRGAQPRQPRPDVEGIFGLWTPVRCGATTILDIGTRPGMIDEMTDIAGRLGIRAYLGPVYRSANYLLDEQGQVQWEWNDPAGVAGLEAASAYARRFDGAFGGRVRAMLYPGQLDTCTPELLQATKRMARELGLRIQLHAAMNLLEFHQILRERQVTPIEYLAQLGFLGPEVTLGHCLFHAGHSWCHYPYVDDLQLLANTGTSVAHAPFKYARMGMALESFDGYRRKGINVALGTDTFPPDLTGELRVTSMVCRLVEGSYLAGRPRDVFEAATLGGAKALGRDDLGRLAPGSKADVIVVNLQQVRFGGVRDPIASLVETATGSDVEMVVVDGETLVEHGRATRVDETALLAEMQEACERYWESLPEWRARGETIGDVAPMSFPVRRA